jgi:hypothetical protein
MADRSFEDAVLASRPMDRDPLPPPDGDAAEVLPAAPGSRSIGVPPPPAKDGGRRWPVVAAVAALVAAVTVAGLMFITSSDGTALASSFSRGESAEYRISIGTDMVLSVDGQRTPIKSSMDADVAWTVTSTDADGTATVELAFSNASARLNGRSVAAPDLPRMTVRLTPDGDVLSSNGTTLVSGGLGQGQLSPGKLRVMLPDGVVKPGDTWSKTSTQTLFGSAIAYTSNGTYLRDERIEGVDAAVVETKATIPMNLTVTLADVAQLLGLPTDQMPADASFRYEGTAASDALTWIDPRGHRLLKTSTNGEIDVTVTADGVPAAAVPSSFQMKGTVTVSLEAA